MRKRDENKEIKRQLLFNTAYELFLHEGFNNTTINDIVKKAGVAKGTFYLYYKDKFDLRERIITRKTYEIFRNAVDHVIELGITDFEEYLLEVIDYIIEYLKDNIMLVTFINKNLILGIYKGAFSEVVMKTDKKTLYQLFLEGLEHNNYVIENPKVVFCIIIELTSSTCYSSIVLNEPVPIAELKPYLYKAITSILSGYKQN